MALDLTISGGDQARALADRLHAITGALLRPALDDGLTRGAGLAVREARHNAETILPQRGGYAAEVAASEIDVDPLHGAATVVVRVTAKGHDPRLDTQGRLRHPVFGNENVWREQQVPAGWFTAAMIRSAVEVELQLLRAVDAALARV
jgi:hypothetical protein